MTVQCLTLQTSALIINSGSVLFYLFFLLCPPLTPLSLTCGCSFRRSLRSHLGQALYQLLDRELSWLLLCEAILGNFLVHELRKHLHSPFCGPALGLKKKQLKNPGQWGLVWSAPVGARDISTHYRIMAPRDDRAPRSCSPDCLPEINSEIPYPNAA